jgi:hypothetical protein
VKTPPKLIVLGYFMNDFSEDYVFPSETVLDGFLVSTFQVSDIKTGQIKKKDILSLEKEVEDFEKKQEKEKRFEGTLTGWLIKNSLLYSKIKVWGKSLTDFFMLKDQHNFTQSAQSDATWIHGFLTLPEKEYPWLQKAWGIHYKNLDALKKLADTYGANLLVVIIPAKDQIYFPEKLRAINVDLDSPRHKLREFFTREKILYLDLLPLFLNYARKGKIETLNPEQDLYWRKDGHWSIKGNHLSGLLVADYILKNNLLEVPAKNQKLKDIKEQLKNIK